jgi:hypothetical protein
MVLLGFNGDRVMSGWGSVWITAPALSRCYVPNIEKKMGMKCGRQQD